MVGRAGVVDEQAEADEAVEEVQPDQREIALVEGEDVVAKVVHDVLSLRQRGVGTWSVSYKSTAEVEYSIILN